MKQIILGMLVGLSLPAFSAEPATVAKREIQHLMSYLASSGCQFNRNGSWYESSKAVAHLNRKYEYLSKRNLATTAEAFIANAASTSSVSGRPYLVRCEGRPDVESSSWFLTELKKFRVESADPTRARAAQ